MEYLKNNFVDYYHLLLEAYLSLDNYYLLNCFTFRKVLYTALNSSSLIFAKQRYENDSPSLEIALSTVL